MDQPKLKYNRTGSCKRRRAVVFCLAFLLCVQSNSGPRPPPFKSLRCRDWNNIPVSDNAETASLSHVMVSMKRDQCIVLSCGHLFWSVLIATVNLAVEFRRRALSGNQASQIWEGNLAMLSNLCRLCNDLGFLFWSLILPGHLSSPSVVDGTKVQCMNNYSILLCLL